MGKIVESPLEPGVFDVFNKRGVKLGHVERYANTLNLIFWPELRVGKQFVRSDLTGIAIRLELRHGEHFSRPRSYVN